MAPAFITVHGAAPIFTPGPGPGDSICGTTPGSAGLSGMTMAGTGSTGTSTGGSAWGSARASGSAAGGGRWPFARPMAVGASIITGSMGPTAILPGTTISTTTISIGKDKGCSTGTGNASSQTATGMFIAGTGRAAGNNGNPAHGVRSMTRVSARTSNGRNKCITEE